MRIIENGSKIQVKSGYASGITGVITESRLYGGSGKKVVYYVDLDKPYTVPFRDNGISAILLEKKDFIVL
jgi:hypothetical protein